MDSQTPRWTYPPSFGDASGNGRQFTTDVISLVIAVPVGLVRLFYLRNRPGKVMKETLQGGDRMIAPTRD